MITSGRRSKRPDSAAYRAMRRQTVAGRTLLDGRRGRRRRGALRHVLSWLNFLLKRFR